MGSKILITGATGKIGRNVIKYLTDKNLKIRALIHTPSKTDLIKGPNVEIFIGDFTKPETLKQPLERVEKAFLVSPSALNQVEMENNFITAAKSAGVKHIVKISIPGANPDSPSNLVKWHWQNEKNLIESGIPYTIIRPSYFMQNTLNFTQTIKSQGSFIGSMKNAKINMIDVRDIAAVVGTTLLNEGHEGKIYNITGPEAITFNNVAKELSKAIGKEVKYIDIPMKEYKNIMVNSGIPEWYADEMIKLAGSYIAGNGESITTIFEELTHTKPHSFTQFATDFADLFNGKV